MSKKGKGKRFRTGKEGRRGDEQRVNSEDEDDEGVVAREIPRVVGDTLLATWKRVG